MSFIIILAVFLRGYEAEKAQTSLTIAERNTVFSLEEKTANGERPTTSVSESSVKEAIETKDKTTTKESTTTKPTTTKETTTKKVPTTVPKTTTTPKAEETTVVKAKKTEKVKSETTTKAEEAIEEENTDDKNDLGEESSKGELLSDKKFLITGYFPAEGIVGKEAACDYGCQPGTCAMNGKQRKDLGLEYGDRIYVEGMGYYIIADCGCNYGVIDIWYETAEEADANTCSRYVYRA